jgi:hypothetical protein
MIDCSAAPPTANGGVRIGVFGTDPSTWYLAQWTGFFNNEGGTTTGMDAMITAGRLTGWAIDTDHFSNSAFENDWFFTDPLVLGNGTWGLFTGTNCCIDTMSAPGQFTLTGITSVPGGTGPGQVGASSGARFTGAARHRHGRPGSLAPSQSN